MQKYKLLNMWFSYGTSPELEALSTTKLIS